MTSVVAGSHIGPASFVIGRLRIVSTQPDSLVVTKSSENPTPAHSSATKQVHSSPRRTDGHRFYGGKRPLGTAPGWTSESTNNIEATEGPSSCCRIQYHDAATPSRSVPVGELISHLHNNPSESVVNIARRLQSDHHWTDEDTDIVQERLSDLRAQQIEFVGRIHKIFRYVYGAFEMDIFVAVQDNFVAFTERL